MSIFSTISVLNRSPRLKKIGGVVIDGYLEESHPRKSSITSFPIEDGSNISDHVKNEPDRVVIRAFISSTPLPSSILRGVPFLSDRVADVFETLNRLRTLKVDNSVICGLKVYKDMYIEDFTPAKNSTTGKGMEFTITLKHIKKVTNQTVAIPNSIIGGDSMADVPQAQDLVDTGQTVGSPSTLVDSNTTNILQIAAGGIP